MTDRTFVERIHFVIMSMRPRNSWSTVRMQLPADNAKWRCCSPKLPQKGKFGLIRSWDIYCDHSVLPVQYVWTKEFFLYGKYTLALDEYSCTLVLTFPRSGDNCFLHSAAIQQINIFIEYSFSLSAVITRRRYFWEYETLKLIGRNNLSVTSLLLCLSLI